MSDITNIKAWTTKQLLTITLAAISLTFSATMIYAEFVIHGERIKVLEERLDKKIILISENKKAINQLQQKVK
jgi:hypothetical protein